METPPIVLFDGVCNLCNAAIDFIIRHDPAGRYRFASLQSAVGQALIRQVGGAPGQLESVVLLENGRQYQKSEAAVRIARHLRGWHWLAWFRVVPRPLRDAVYDLVGRYRYRWFGRRDTCRVPAPEERARFLDEEVERGLD